MILMADDFEEETKNINYEKFVGTHQSLFFWLKNGVHILVKS